MGCPTWALALSIHLHWSWRPPKALRCLLSVGHARALLIPPFCHSGRVCRSRWALWTPGTSWMGLAGFMLFSVEQEASSSLSLQGCISGHLFIVILLPHFPFHGVMLAPSCPGQGSVAVPGLSSLGQHWPIAPTLPLGLLSPDFPQETL